MSLVPFTFEQLGIDFDNNTINFYVTFGLSGACMSVDGASIAFSLHNIKQYLAHNVDLCISFICLYKRRPSLLRYNSAFFHSG